MEDDDTPFKPPGIIDFEKRHIMEYLASDKTYYVSECHVEGGIKGGELIYIFISQ